MRWVTITLVVGMLVVSISPPARAEWEKVGVGQAGDSFAKVLVEFSDGTLYGFGLAFQGPASGKDLLGMIEAWTFGQPGAFTTQRIQDPSYGTYIDGISYKGHSDSGYGGGEQWWHYWVWDPPRLSPDDWTLSPVGASSRVVVEDSADAWSYGQADAPRMPGDANLNTCVDAGDLALMGPSWMLSGQDWFHGDFTGDGYVDSGDLALLGANWGFGYSWWWSPCPPASAPLPEPATIAMIGAGALALCRRRIR
jgi:hypothetical protein